MKMICAALAVSLLLPGVPAVAQDDAEPAPSAYRLVMDYDRPGLNIPHWQIVVPERGMVQYTGVPVKGTDPGLITFRISDAGRAKLGTLLASSKSLSPCETKSKGIANMGIKKVEYTPVGGTPVQCSFNFTDNKSLNEAFTYLLAVAGTVQAGLEIERLHRYDRLGLDPVMIRLTEDVKEGRAAELSAIRPALESLVTDPAVLERVRTRAQQLLEVAKQQDAGQ